MTYDRKREGRDAVFATPDIHPGPGPGPGGGGAHGDGDRGEERGIEEEKTLREYDIIQNIV